MIASPVIAHRGASAEAPENTLPALAAAADAGARWVEIDAQLLADGTAVVFHDDRLERCTDGEGALITQDWPAVCDLDAGRWFGPAFAGTRIPRLTDALALCRERALGLNLELKLSPGADRAALAEGVLDALAREPLPPGRVLLSSFDPEVLEHLRTRAPELPRGLICRRVPDDLAALARRLRLASLHPDHQYLRGTARAAAQALGLEIYAWTVNDPARARALLLAGASGIITDNPRQLIEAGL